MREQKALPLRALNHISRVCQDVATSAAFYRDVLGFSEIKRPSSFQFEGAWLFNYGIGIHLIAGTPVSRSRCIDPKSDHLSFQVDCLDEVEQQLHKMGMEYVRNTIEECGVLVTQLFFHDPDHNMIEICNCDLIPVVPLDTELLCTTCMTASFSLGTAVSMPARDSRDCLSREISECLDASEPSHSHSSSSSMENMGEIFRCDDRCDEGRPSSASLFTVLIQESTPHTGIRMTSNSGSAAGMRRVCSMNFPTTSMPLISKDFGSMRMAQ